MLMAVVATLAVIGLAVVLAIVFRISGITSVEGAFKIGRSDNTPKQLEK